MKAPQVGAVPIHTGLSVLKSLPTGPNGAMSLAALQTATPQLVRPDHTGRRRFPIIEQVGGGEIVEAPHDLGHPDFRASGSLKTFES